MSRCLRPLLVLAGICLACSLPWTGGISIKHDGNERSFDPIAAYIVPNSSGGHSIQITNYPVQLAGTYDHSKIRPTEEGHYRIDVAILKKQAGNKRLVIAGEYVDQDPREEPRNKIVRATIYRFAEGKEEPIEFDGRKLRGVVKILSVQDNNVEGTIDVTDDRSMIKGRFSAVTLQ